MKKQGQARGRQARAGRAEKLKVLSALTASVFALSAQAATSEAWVATSTKAHDPLAAVHVAPLKAGEQVNIVVSLKLRNKAELDALTSKLMAGAAGARPLTSAQFMAKYAPTAAQAQDVVAYLRGQGFTNIEVAANNLLVTATGSAAAIRTAFKADLHEYNVNGRRAYANVTDAMVPAHLSGTVLGVVGLQNVHMMHTHAQRLNVQPQATTQAITGISIPNFPSIYGASSMPSATTGTIGIITAGSLTQTITDLKNFASNSGYPVPNVTKTVVGTAGTSTSGTDEWNMDSQSSLAAAGGSISHMILYNVTDLSDSALTAGYNKAVTDNLARAINVSLGGCETSQGSVEATQDAIFQTAVSQGQMFSVSSGDSGAYECGATAGKAQSYPAVSPYVMAIGGTTLSTTNGNTWADETVWSCSSASTCQQSSSGGAGGGPSLTENAPSWQTSAGVLGTSTKRGVPDVSFDAAPSSGALVLVNGVNTQIGGTSLAAPLWAGFWTRIQAAHGNTLAFPASAIYSGAAANPGWFHDVVSGNQGYAAAVGWDYASGYGSVQIAALSASLGSSTPPPPPPPPPSSNLVANPGFESGMTSWTATSGVGCTNSTCTGETAHSGTGFAWLDGYGTTHTDTVSQSITIPATATSATLSFYLHIDTAETTTTTAYDKLTVSVTPSGGTATTVATYSNLNAASGYVLHTISLSSFIGKTISLKFTGVEDSSLQTSFVLDDVSVTAQ